jgi:hypothetical protein
MKKRNLDTHKDKANTSGPDMSRANKFVTQDAGELKVTPPPPGDTTEEDYRNYPFPRGEGE